MIRFVFVAFLLLSSIPAYSMPQFLELYRRDPFRNPNVDGCITCHMSPQGGDARNPFGQAFESGGEQITTLLRAQFPDRFVYPISRVSDALTIHFSDPSKKQMVVEAGGMKNLVDADRLTVNGTAATTTTSPVRIAIPAGQEATRTTSTSEVPVDPYAREGAFFGSNVVNLPNGKPQKAGGLDFFIGHRFAQDVKQAGFGSLFGFDSGAAITYGVRAGLTDRLSVSLYRTSLALAQTISIGSSFQVARQSASMPLTLQVRGSVDGKHNFGLYKEENNPRLLERQYSPVLQVVATRTFKDRVSFVMVPTYAWNTRDENNGEDLPGGSFGTRYNNTIALGLGGGVRFLPSVSLVGEIIPRWKYRGQFGGDLYKDMPGFSIGLQKSTFRHTFELVIARQLSMTPAQVATQGNDKFRVGFNIYRKLR